MRKIDIAVKSHHFRLGVIDLGTNSVRFDVHELPKKGEPRLLHREKLMVRLGENVFTAGRLDPRATKRTLQAFVSFHQTARDLGVDKIIAFGTSALREASDGFLLIRSVRAQTGIELRVLSGREEARLIARGILAHRSRTEECFALVDIGGGSTEITICRDGRVIYSESLPLGVARLQQVFLRQSPPSPEAIAALKKHVRKLLRSKLETERWPKVNYLVGSSGTIRVLMRILKKSGADKSVVNAMRKTSKQLSKLGLPELLKVQGMEAKRVDMILAGALLFEEILNVLKPKKVQVTSFSLRDGILLEEALDARNAKAVSHGWDFEALLQKATELGGERAHLKRVVQSAESLFERLKPLHRLDSSWKPLLSLAVLFRDAGKTISAVHHERHSYYIVKNLGLPFPEAWKTEFVAQLCLRHEGGRLNVEDLPFVGEKSSVRKRAFQKCLAMLRIIDALDPLYRKQTSPKQIRINGEKVLLRLAKGSWMELAMLRLQQKKSLFEKVFSRLLSAESV